MKLSHCTQFRLNRKLSSSLRYLEFSRWLPGSTVIHQRYSFAPPGLHGINRHGRFGIILRSTRCAPFFPACRTACVSGTSFGRSPFPLFSGSPGGSDRPGVSRRTRTPLIPLDARLKNLQLNVDKLLVKQFSANVKLACQRFY